jgi:hypothetical protein
VPHALREQRSRGLRAIGRSRRFGVRRADDDDALGFTLAVVEHVALR